MKNQANELLDNIVIVARAIRDQEQSQRLDSYATIKGIMEELMTMIEWDERADYLKERLGVIDSAAWIMAKQTGNPNADRECVEIIESSVAMLKEKAILRVSP